MQVEVQAARPGDGAGLARVWLDNARYYIRLFPDDFRLPDEAGLDEWFEAQLAQPRDGSELHLVAVVDGSVAAFAYARLTEPDEDASRQMLAESPLRRVHVEALGTADAYQRQRSGDFARRGGRGLGAWTRRPSDQCRDTPAEPALDPVLGAADGLPPPVGQADQALAVVADLRRLLRERLPPSSVGRSLPGSACGLAVSCYRSIRSWTSSS